ncbi:hypothetical protein A0J57_18590 [Sphingobium sp. 22B]|uniref:indolepyruvate ferredoxin oxidoreductase family protein n=1 Tax=unclassified Sphingobium TaxID=2611147 RepID=UPI000783ADA0|nr:MULTISPECIES: indolepyruvate ferredoxin oxidoreductase family protein [unclassified Sphingobium]KXU29420.1 hypothetical protein AXW74_23025 [Sphingobium sp. AM]KYC30847.1 hypothetical protein A0J57_18590 [Sphingobium sp. 22B]OAP29381.1 hypothetical protein A8O16_23890 [Sphingobium sp. 20006FA]
MSSSVSIASRPDEASLHGVALDDKYRRRDGRIMLTGVQALVRLMLVQADRDKAAGLNSGGFVSGYRGSPLGTLDTAFAGARMLTAERNIVVRPAVNEELGATAVAGTQQIAQTPGASVDGVFALWYGKGPGLDRASDAIRHGNSAGSSPHGGVLLAVGDDHIAKSSTLVVHSEDVCAALRLPLLYPSDAHEIVTLGLHGFALSRHTGSWAALKIVTDVADATASVDADEMDMPIVLPDIAPPAGGLHVRWPDPPIEQEARQQQFRLPAIFEYARANRLDRPHHRTPASRMGIVSAGKSWLDLLEALRLIGLDEARLEALGIALYKVAMIWPLEPEGLRAFADGLSLILVVEEKGPLIEGQIKNILYGSANAPRIWGKAGATGEPLLPAHGDLTPERIAAAIAPATVAETGDTALRDRMQPIEAALADQRRLALPPAIRRPHFCSGCPHNRSTVVPEGSRATAGIGCHGLAAYFMPNTASWAQMGGEGIHWMGLSPFTEERHVFANIGDGTYFHSGILAIRQAIAANLNITYKLLYNSAVAMTGGQQVDGELSVERILAQLHAEGVERIVLLSEDPGRYASASPVRGLARVGHRDELEATQRALRETPGVSVIVYEQMCATEKRRLRKRGKLAEPPARVFINERVCEGCGDCSVKSNCLSVEPVDTAFGAKRRINQSSCNKDMSCLDGFCPSFVTVEGATPRKRQAASGGEPLPDPPARTAPDHERILVAGIGGTGVVTVGALVAMAAHIGGRKAGVLDQVGMAQKGGAVTSHVHVASDPITALRIPAGGADLILACDQIVGNAKDVMSAMAPGRTRVVANADVAITGEFTRNRNAVVSGELLARRLAERAGEEGFVAFPFSRLSEGLFGDAIGSNLMMLGAAWQKGWIALDREAFEAAIDLNGQATAMNRQAFAWGRRLIVDPQAVHRAAGLAGSEPETLDALIEGREVFLTQYQDAAWAARFRASIDRVRHAESRVGGETLTRTAANALFKFMAYKDEYEVARLYTDPAFAESLGRQFDGRLKLRFHMAPPILSRRDPVTGQPRKRRFGPWMLYALRLLAPMKRVRGTALDLFGYTAERRTERALIGEYEALLERLIAGLSRDTLDEAVAIAALPMEVRGYGHVKEAAIAAYRAALADRLAHFERPAGRSATAA